jgi:hypothetical protein
LVGFGRAVCAQTQNNIGNDGCRVCQGRNARGINRTHSVNNVEKLTQLLLQTGRFSATQLKARQLGDTGNVGNSQRHSVLELKAKAKKRLKQVQNKAQLQPIGYYPVFSVVVIVCRIFMIYGTSRLAF